MNNDGLDEPAQPDPESDAGHVGFEPFPATIEEKMPSTQNALAMM